MVINGMSLLYFVWIAMLISLLFLIPKDKVRLAILAFLFKQVLTWPLGLFVVEMGWIQFPIRFFENTSRTSFTFEYFFYPVMCAYFLVYFPNGKSLPLRAAYYIIFCSVLTLAELLILHHSNLIRYIHWSAYWTWVTLFVTVYITRKFCVWFFRPDNKA